MINRKKIDKTFDSPFASEWGWEPDPGTSAHEYEPPPEKLSDISNPCYGPHYHYYYTNDNQKIISLLENILKWIKKIEKKLKKAR